MALHLTGGNLAKARKLNPYKRITKGVEKNITVDGAEVVAITDNAGKYSYLAIDGVDYYVSDALEAGGEYATSDIVAQPKPVAVPKVDPETGEVIAPAKRTRRKKAEAANEGEAAAA